MSCDHSALCAAARCCIKEHIAVAYTLLHIYYDTIIGVPTVFDTWWQEDFRGVFASLTPYQMAKRHKSFGRPESLNAAHPLQPAATMKLLGLLYLFATGVLCQDCSFEDVRYEPMCPPDRSFAACCNGTSPETEKDCKLCMLLVQMCMRLIS